jgi:hypothetical protein
MILNRDCLWGEEIHRMTLTLTQGTCLITQVVLGVLVFEIYKVQYFLYLMSSHTNLHTFTLILFGQQKQKMTLDVVFFENK